MNFDIIREKVSELLAIYVPKLALIIVTWFVGMKIIKLLVKTLDKAMTKSKIEESLRNFILSLTGILLKVLLFISLISMFGVKMTSFIAILGAMAFAVGMSLQGSLSNFAGGVLLIFFKPFKIGDFIEAQGFAGTVHAIEMFNTTLKTPDNKTILIPNGALAGGSIVNYSTEKQRRVDFVFGIGYEDDIEKARKIILDIISADNRILTEPQPFVRVGELADSSVNFTVRVWVNAENYWNVHFDMIENIKAEFDKNNISIPYPQTDVHLYKK